MKNFQSESKLSGNEFEDLVQENIELKNGIIVGKDYHIKDLGIELDFLADFPNRTEYIEAKGGKTGNKKRPGAKRTDNVKKAICNGALLKHSNPNAYFVVYFSSKPKKNSYSYYMIETALNANYIDEVRYLDYVK
jgi:hypothetical protein